MHQLIQDFLHFFARNEWLAQIGLLLVGMAIFHWISRKIYYFLTARFSPEKYPWSYSFFESMHVPWMVFFWLLTFTLILPVVMSRFHIDTTHLHGVNTLRSLFFIGAFYWSILSFITKMEVEIAPRMRGSFVRDKTTVRALALLTRVVLTIVVVLAILPKLGFETSSLLAFGSVGGIAVGFAAKDTLANFLGGVMIFWDRPFSVGDWIRSPDRNIEGIVEHIGWRLTRIRTPSKRALYVPNAIFSTIAIENPSRMTHRQINTIVGIRYDDVAAVPNITKAIEEMLRHHPSIDVTQSTTVNLTELAASSLNLEINAFTRAVESAKFKQVMQDVLLKTIAIIAEHGAECAFPTTQVLLSHDDRSNFGSADSGRSI
jgi:MscS family membrane protein